MMVERLGHFKDTVRRGRFNVDTYYVYRGNPGCPDIIASCPTRDAADAAARLLSGSSSICIHQAPACDDCIAHDTMLAMSS